MRAPDKEEMASEIKHLVDNIANERYGNASMAIREIYMLTKKKYAEVFINGELKKRKFPNSMKRENLKKVF